MARKAPAFQFYVDDFIGGTHYMAAASVGVYVRLLCFQFASGLLPVCLKKLARIAGVSDDEFKSCWGELECKFVSDGNGHVFNKRLKDIVDEQVARSEVRAAAGKIGGKTQAKLKQTPKQNSSKRPSKNEAKGEGDGVGEGEGIEAGTGEGSGTKNGTDYSTDFLNFWAAFPRGRKKSKGLAWTAWQSAIKRISIETLLTKASEYAMSGEGRSDHVKMPSTWLNQNCWEDDPAAWTAKDRAISDPRGTYALLDQRRRERENETDEE